ncbi:MAG: type II toxin-antitoxin system RelE/ParE family toxin [Deltaproteobacteria bacterium]|nr:type II toxin-antitoxin system RelE/ParE family toxin [Deltaproteobacteria bacterium]
MSYKIAFKKSVSRDLKRLDKDQAEIILAKIEHDLPEKAEAFPLLTGKFAGLRKLRIGDYRVIYTIIEDTALILRISHRREAYRNIASRST